MLGATHPFLHMSLFGHSLSRPTESNVGCMVRGQRTGSNTPQFYFSVQTRVCFSQERQPAQVVIKNQDYDSAAKQKARLCAQQIKMAALLAVLHTTPIWKVGTHSTCFQGLHVYVMRPCCSRVSSQWILFQDKGVELLETTISKGNRKLLFLVRRNSYLLT